MTAQRLSNIHGDCDRFLHHVVVHHRNGDYYPDPRVIGRETHLSAAQLEDVLIGLRALGWIAQSPYSAERIRLTPRCWTFLQQLSERSTTILHAVSENECFADRRSAQSEVYILQ